jgi:integrase
MTKHRRSQTRICQRLKIIQEQLGHSYASTTSLYTSVSSDFKQRVVQQMITRRLRLEDSGG